MTKWKEAGNWTKIGRMFTSCNKGYVNICTSRQVDFLLQTILTAQADEYIGPVIKAIMVKTNTISSLCTSIVYSFMLNG